ncbi:MAG: hypothetical protein ABFD69_13200 [Candidatus Sumerlaeia bacterium]
MAGDIGQDLEAFCRPFRMNTRPDNLKAYAYRAGARRRIRTPTTCRSKPAPHSPGASM